MQPTPELDASFETLLQKVLESASQHADNQLVLCNYLSSHPDLFSVRFRTLYLQDNLEILIRELKRTCAITEENVELLKDIINGIGTTELDNAFRKHQYLINKWKDPNFTSIDPEVISCLTDNIGNKWMPFCHEMGIKDGKVDEIERDGRNIKERMDKVVEWIQLNVPFNQQMKQIMTALCKCDRKDLAENLHAIITSKYVKSA